MRGFFTFVRFDNDPDHPLSRNEHRRWKALGVAYLILWVSVGVVVRYVLDWPSYLKWLFYFLLIIITPALGDLCESYDRYLERASRSRASSKDRGF